MKSFINKIFVVLGLTTLLGATSCVGDLDLKPNDPNQKTELTEADLALVLAKCYSSLAVSGQGGPDGSSDISGLDGGTSQYTRALYMMNEFTTDETKWIWPDVGVFDLNTNTWGADNANIFGTYSRLYVHIAVCNNFLRITNGNSSATVQQYRLEARALRALSYYNVIDLFGNGGFVDETVDYGTNPTQKTRKELYDWLVTELKDIISVYPDATPIYGRLGKDGVQALLARLYLNAKVFTNGEENGYADCAAVCEDIISRHLGGGYNGSGLAKHYLYLFCGTNDVYMPGGSNHAENEILWGVPYDAKYIQPYGGTEFLIAAATKNMTWSSNDAYMNSSEYGLTENWGCMHATSAFADKFTSGDNRWSMWCKEDNGFKKDNTNFSNFIDGYGVVKFTNLIAGANGEWSAANGGIYGPKDDQGNPTTPAVTTRFPNTDLPIIRLADVYLMYAECNVVGGVGDASKALTYINYVRGRAGVKTWTSSDMTASNILDERCRELYWENTRRTDLVRFNKFTGADYVWPWKGNNVNGISIENYRNLFPIPTNVIAAQPEFKQNPGY